jgi:hypothetical protein
MWGNPKIGFLFTPIDETYFYSSRFLASSPISTSLRYVGFFSK